VRFGQFRAIGGGDLYRSAMALSGLLSAALEELMPSPSRQRRPHWSDRRLPQQLRSQPSVRNGLRAWVCGLGLCVLHEAAFQAFHQIDDLGRLSNRTRVVTSPFGVASTSSPCASIAVSETRRLKSAGSPFNDRRGAVQVEDLGGTEGRPE
jgi:hypothetical protein